MRNSQDFAQFSKSQCLSETETLVSFDVVSLFTHVPNDLAVKVSREQLENDPSLSQRTSVDDICSLFSLHLEATTYLVFAGRVYQQVHGTALGSLMSVVVANQVIKDIEHRALATFHTTPCILRKYVDNTCTPLPQNMVEPFHKHHISTDLSIQFTVEIESRGQLPFLDVPLTR